MYGKDLGRNPFNKLQLYPLSKKERGIAMDLERI